MINETINKYKDDFEKTAGHFKEELGKLRTGRASVSLVEDLMVDYYGAKSPLKQVASITVPEARTIAITPWSRDVLVDIEKAIRESGLGLNPQTEGQSIRVPIPDLSQERRAELTKVAHKYAEGARVAIRNVRRDGMDALKKAEKAGDISQDEQKVKADKIQTFTDQHIKLVDEALAVKEKEIMQV